MPDLALVGEFRATLVHPGYACGPCGVSVPQGLPCPRRMTLPSSTSSPPTVQIRGVTKTFGPKLAVNNLDLSIAQGSLCGFIGPNGAGKTTTIRMIMSIIFPDKGEVSVLGKASAIESKDRIGYLPEERGLYRKMKVGPFLTYMGRLKGMDASSETRGGESLESRVKA